jgi:hypothetical protein
VVAKVKMIDRLIGWLNQLLVIDFFLVLLSFFWLAIAAFGRFVGLPLGLDLWYSLWQPVFTPAIGIVIAGTLLSGLFSWLANAMKPN